MNKKEAAEYLGLSTRAVERAVTRGKLRVQYKKHKRGHLAIFNPEEVRCYKMQLETPYPQRPFTEPPATPPTSTGQQAPLMLGNVIPLSDASEQRPFDPQPALVRVADKLTLSLSEAASLSGLSQEFLLQAIRDKQLKAFKHERDWRIKRADLDVFVRNL